MGTISPGPRLTRLEPSLRLESDRDSVAAGARCRRHGFVGVPVLAASWTAALFRFGAQRSAPLAAQFQPFQIRDHFLNLRALFTQRRQYISYVHSASRNY